MPEDRQKTQVGCNWNDYAEHSPVPHDFHPGRYDHDPAINNVGNGLSDNIEHHNNSPGKTHGILGGKVDWPGW